MEECDVILSHTVAPDRTLHSDESDAPLTNQTITLALVCSVMSSISSSVGPVVWSLLLSTKQSHH